ncbi:hypothetical protein BG004_004771 [Podila humilis]|nr:hypothetical protein BG004_004771 [Podila humilis]
MDKFKEKITSLRAEADIANQKAEGLERDLAAAKTEITAKEQEAVSHTNRISNLEAQLEKAETSGAESKAKARELELKVEELERQVAKLTKQNDALETKNEELLTENKKTKDELDEVLGSLEGM